MNDDNSIHGINYRPNLLNVKTIVHEVLHAEMFRKLLSLSNNNGRIDTGKLTSMLKNGDYPGMLVYYLRYGNKINSSWQHQQMAQHYREVIGRILQEYDTGVNVDLNTTPDRIYMDLAWEGLDHSELVAWQDVLSKSERNRIRGVIKNYIAQNKNEKCN